MVENPRIYRESIIINYSTPLRISRKMDSEASKCQRYSFWVSVNEMEKY